MIDKSHCAYCTKLPDGTVTKEWLVKAIQTAQTNVNILKIELRGPKPYPGAELQLEYERHVLELLRAEYEGRLHITPSSEDKEKGADKNGDAQKSLRQKEKEAVPPKKRLFCMGPRNK